MPCLRSAAALLVMLAGSAARAEPLAPAPADGAKVERSWDRVVKTRTVLLASFDGGTQRRVRIDHGFLVLTRLNDDSLSSRKPECRAALLERWPRKQPVASGAWVAIPVAGTLLADEIADQACKRPEWLPPRPEGSHPEPVGSVVIGERGPVALVLVGYMYEEVFFVAGLSSAEQRRAVELGYGSLDMHPGESAE